MTKENLLVQLYINYRFILCDSKDTSLKGTLNTPFLLNYFLEEQVLYNQNAKTKHFFS